MEYDVHTLLDGLTLVATAWVIYMLRFKLSDTYQAAQDSVQVVYVVRPHPEPCTHVSIRRKIECRRSGFSFSIGAAPVFMSRVLLPCVIV